MLVTELYREEEKEWLLSIPEILARIANAFKRVSIDWVRGDAEYDRYRNKILSLAPPAVIRDCLPLRNRRTVWVAVSDSDGPDDWVCFFTDKSDITIEFPTVENRDLLRPTVEKLAQLLEYHIAEDKDEYP